MKFPKTINIDGVDVSYDLVHIPLSEFAVRIVVRSKTSNVTDAMIYKALECRLKF